MNGKPTIILVDADIIIYRAACAAEKSFYRISYRDKRSTTVSKDYPIGTYKKDIDACKDLDLQAEDIDKVQWEKIPVPEDVSHAIHNARNMLGDIREAITEKFGEGIMARLYLSPEDKSNFRYSVAKTKPYKGNRKDPKPVHYEAVREYLVNKFGTLVVRDEEADDGLGIAQMKNLDQSVIVSIDKDLNMIPGWHYNFVKKEFQYIEFGEAAKNFYMQMLTGDAVDNIPGLPGWGPVKAEKWFKETCGTKLPSVELLHEATKKAYITHEAQVRPDLPEAIVNRANDYFLEQGRLLWIRRKPEEIWSGEVDMALRN